MLAYSSRANRIVERQHHTIRESIVKACEGTISKRPEIAPQADWATTCNSTGHTPFYMAHGIKPILPFDITLFTLLVPDIPSILDAAKLLAIQTRQLQMHEDDLGTLVLVRNSSIDQDSPRTQGQALLYWPHGRHSPHPQWLITTR